MDEVTLAQLAHENLVETLMASGSQVDGALVEHGEGVAVIGTSLPIRWFNQVLVTAPEANEEAIAAAVTRMRARTERYFVNLRAGVDDDFIPLMDRLGLVARDGDLSTPGLAMHPLPTTTPVGPPPGLDLRRVSDPSGIRDHVTVAASGFGMAEAWLASIMTEALVSRPGVTLLVGYFNDVPVTTGLGVRTDGALGIYNIATIESARSHGFGAAVTSHLVASGLEDGCEAAILQSTPRAQPLYERLGFRLVLRYRGYAPPE